jgi:two-component system response regulator MprA
MARVLLIEDDRDFSDNLEFMIGRGGHEVVCARNGKAALDHLHDSKFDIILLDLMMPDMDGWSFRLEVMRDPELAAIPIVIVSGVANLESEWKKLHVVDYIAKPVDLDRLYRIIDSHVV